MQDQHRNKGNSPGPDSGASDVQLPVLTRKVVEIATIGLDEEQREGEFYSFETRYSYLLRKYENRRKADQEIFS